MTRTGQGDWIIIPRHPPFALGFRTGHLDFLLYSWNRPRDALRSAKPPRLTFSHYQIHDPTPTHVRPVAATVRNDLVLLHQVGTDLQVCPVLASPRTRTDLEVCPHMSDRPGGLSPRVVTPSPAPNPQPNTHARAARRRDNAR